MCIRDRSHCEHKTIQNQHPSPCGEGYGDTLKRGCKGLLSLKKGSSGVVKRHHILLGFDAFQFSENLASSIKSSNSGVLEFCWPWPVSYTHLDVYKRQGASRPKMVARCAVMSGVGRLSGSLPGSLTSAAWWSVMSLSLIHI